MSRYDIAIDKKEGNLKKIKKALYKIKVSGVNTKRESVDSTESIQGETGISNGIPSEESNPFRRYPNRSGIGINLGPALSQEELNRGIGLVARSDFVPSIRREVQIEPQVLNTGGEVTSQADGTITTRIPVSRFLTLTGPNGFRVMIPLRMVNFRIDDENGDKRISIKLSNQQASSLNTDILQGIRRLD